MNRPQFITTLLCIPKWVKGVFNQQYPYDALLDERFDLKNISAIEGNGDILFWDETKVKFNSVPDQIGFLKIDETIIYYSGTNDDGLIKDTEGNVKKAINLTS